MSDIDPLPGLGPRLSRLTGRSLPPQATLLRPSIPNILESDTRVPEQPKPAPTADLAPNNHANLPTSAESIADRLSEPETDAPETPARYTQPPDTEQVPPADKPIHSDPAPHTSDTADLTAEPKSSVSPRKRPAIRVYHELQKPVTLPQEPQTPAPDIEEKPTIKPSLDKTVPERMAEPPTRLDQTPDPIAVDNTPVRAPTDSPTQDSNVTPEPDAARPDVRPFPTTHVPSLTRVTVETEQTTKTRRQPADVPLTSPPETPRPTDPPKIAKLEPSVPLDPEPRGDVAQPLPKPTAPVSRPQISVEIGEVRITLRQPDAPRTRPAMNVQRRAARAHAIPLPGFRGD